MGYRWGFSLYVGIPGSGKTTLAREHLARDIVRSGCPALVVDSEGAGNLSDIPRASTVEAACREVWDHGRSVRYVPGERREVEALCSVARDMGHVLMLVDEVSYYLRAPGVLPSLEHLVRAHRHLSVSLYATSQFFTDFAPFARSCASAAWFFRSEDPSALDMIERHFQIPPERLRALPQGEAVAWSRLDAWRRAGGAPPGKNLKNK